MGIRKFIENVGVEQSHRKGKIKVWFGLIYFWRQNCEFWKSVNAKVRGVMTSEILEGKQIAMCSGMAFDTLVRLIS